MNNYMRLMSLATTEEQLDNILESAEAAESISTEEFDELLEIYRDVLEQIKG